MSSCSAKDQTMRFVPSCFFKTSPGLLAAGLVAGAFALTSHAQSTYEAGAAQKLAADQNTVVDCLLPGAVRRLGAGVTYLAARKPVLLKVAECEVRGGEYVLYDRADPKTAYKIWEAAARAGDADAQRRLAQILEMGIGTESDYKGAAEWYRKSAEQGNRASAMSLAALYETGMGVPKSVDDARRWYERAGSVAPAGGGSAPSRENALIKQLQDSEKRVTELEAKLARGGAAQAELVQAKLALSDSVKQAEAQGAAAALLEPRRERPVIELVDPNLIRAGPTSSFNLRGQVQVKKITGWVNLGQKLSMVTVNGSGAEIDNNGFFSKDVALQGGSTPVSIIALSKDGVLERKYGFKTNLLIDATADQIISALNDYVQTLRDTDVLVIYYAGHGMLDTRNKRAHWIPVDGETERDTHWIPSYRVTDLVNKMKARKVLVVSDSCYSGGLAANLTGVVTGMRPGLGDEAKSRAVDALWDSVSRTILTSGMLAPVLDDEGSGKAKHSLFARALLEVLDEAQGVVTGDALYTAVRARVVFRSQKLNFDQTPFYTGLAHAGHEGGDFLLVPVAR